MPPRGECSGSWIYFSVIQRKLLSPDDFPNLDVLANRLTAFEARYNTAARPFDWRFSRDGINRLVAGSPREPDELTA